ncbi:MAG: hypothetical protein ORN98_02475 [Alphaproteobacteria bacterium]|nr:hypothetical protein [Alphaproteobacteria bacterium]
MVSIFYLGGDVNFTVIIGEWFKKKIDAGRACLLQGGCCRQILERNNGI